MNERIRELEKQSYVDVDAGDGVYQKFSTQKFAELIIHECMNLTEGCRDKYLNSAPYKIAKHFGVK